MINKKLKMEFAPFGHDFIPPAAGEPNSVFHLYFFRFLFSDSLPVNLVSLLHAFKRKGKLIMTEVLGTGLR
jgi:hypothetical protein